MSYEMPDTIIQTIPLGGATELTTAGFNITFSPPGAAYYLASVYLLNGDDGGAGCTMTLRKITDASEEDAAAGATVIDLTSALDLSTLLLVPTAFTFLTTAAVRAARRFKPLQRLTGLMAGTVTGLADVHLVVKWVRTT
jgi:hypothetical protein